MSVDLLVVGGYLATVDDDRRVFADGAFAVVDGEIIDVGHSQDLRSRHADADQTIDARGDLVMPGMVDSHRHLGLLAHELAGQPSGRWPERVRRGGFEDGGDIPLLVGAFARPGGLAAGAEPEDTYAAARAGAVELLRSGVTCLNDGGGGDADAIAAAVTDVGLRAGVTVASADLGVDDAGRPRRVIDSDELLARAEAFTARQPRDRERIRPWLNLFFPVGASDALLEGTAALAARLDMGVGGHAAALATEDEVSRLWHNRGTIDRLDDHGLLDSRFLGAHMGFVEDRHVDRLASAQACVAHCPTSSSTIPAGYFRHGKIPKLAAAGVTLGLGTDNGGRGSLVHQMTHVCFHKDRTLSSATLDAPFVFEMVTRQGARAAGFDDLVGSIAVGKRADVLIVDRSDMRWDGWDPIRFFVDAGIATDVRLVLVDGQVRVVDGEVLGVDMQEVRRELRAAVERLRARAT